MEVINRLQYGRGEVADAEVDIGLYEKQTKNEGLNDGAMVTYRFSPDYNSFIELDSTLLDMHVQTLMPDRKLIDQATHQVFLLMPD